MTFKKRLCAAASILAAAIAQSAPAAGESLQDALAVAYRTNPTIRAARAQFDATDEGRAQARAGILPQVSGEASIQINRGTNTTNFAGAEPDQAQDFETRSYGFNAEQSVFSGLRNFNTIRQARARSRAGGAQLIGSEQQVLQQAATAYFDVLRTTRVYESNFSNMKVLMRQLEEAQLRFKVGEITKTDVAQAEARLAGARAQLASSQSQLAAARATYVQVIGEAPGTLDPNPTLPPVPQSLEEAKEYARRYAPNLIAAQETEEASRRQIAIARGALAPNVSLNAGYQFAREPNFFVEESEALVYGVRATVPIFQGGLNYSRIREAKALNRADRQRVTEAERQAEASVTTAWEQLIASRATIASARTQVSANELALEGVRRENQVGTRTTLDVLNAEQELLNSQVSLANAERDERAATFSVLAAAGLLTLENVGLAVEDGDANVLPDDAVIALSPVELPVSDEATSP